MKTRVCMKLLADILLLFSISSRLGFVSSAQVIVSKCCSVDSVLLETAPGVRSCARRTELTLDESNNSKWRPTFFDLSSETEVMRPESYQLNETMPQCQSLLGEVPYPVYHHEGTYDQLRLLQNGSLAHYLSHGPTHKSETLLYPPEKYCMDDMILGHNATQSEGHVLEFAYICVSNQISIQHMVDLYIYPIGLGVSILCLIVTFLLYSFLPQLRDLSGKFILANCFFLSMTFSLLLVKVFGWKDTNVEKLVTEFLLHASVLGVWLSLNCMGHHVWKIIRSKSVFTRVSDGKRLCYYSIYHILTFTVVVVVAVCIQYFIAGRKFKDNNHNWRHNEIGWECLTAFYIPIITLFLINIYFYITAQRRITRQMIYNRNMQHFQVNFDLFAKFLLVLTVWWILFLLSLLKIASLIYISNFFNVITGPLVFLVAMCRTRVAFLFKKYFCYDSCCFGCCKNHDFIEVECQELSVIDNLKEKQQKMDQDEEDGITPISMLLPGNQSSDYKEMSKSLYNVRSHAPGEVPPPPIEGIPVGRVKRMLKSNSLTAIANINWGWRKETSV